jgi:transcriptional regulator with XRE-family HTH domain
VVDYKTPEELEKELGAQLRNLRILRNLDQRTLAAQAGVALNAVKRLETGQTSTTRSLVKVLRILQRTEWLGTLAPEVSINPLNMGTSRAPRKKVYRSRKASPEAPVNYGTDTGDV